MTVLTGYSARKAALLNWMLSETHGRRYAAIVNEFGIDNELVANADEEVFDMNSGCICCAVRGDLIRIIGNLLKRKDKFHAVLIDRHSPARPPLPRPSSSMRMCGKEPSSAASSP
jgi:G3E family GTPase